MIIEYIYILLWVLIAIGIAYAFKQHGELQHAKGITDAIHMHYRKELQYKITKDKFGEEHIEVKINGG